MINGYFNINVEIPKPLEIRSNLIMLTIESNVVSPLSYLGIVNSSIDRLKLNELICHNNDVSFHQKIDLAKEIELFSQKNTIYLEALYKGLCESIRSGVVVKAIIFHPYVRLSLISHTLITSHFALIQYLDNKYEFWITEEIPEENLISKEYQYVEDYVNSALFNVRRSVMLNTDIYTYIPSDEKLEFEEIIFSYNYILSHFIQNNFNLDIKKKVWRVSFAANEIFDYSLNRKKNNSKSIYFNDAEKIILVGIKEENMSYFEYMKEALSKLYCYEILYSVYTKYKKYKDNNNITSLQNTHCLIMAPFIN